MSHDSARIGRHGNVVVCTPAKAKPRFKGQQVEAHSTLRFGTDGLYRMFNTQGHMTFVGTLADLLHLSVCGSTLYFCR